MESKKSRSAPRWTVILQDILSQNRATLEAVESSRAAHDERMDRAEQKSEARFTVIGAAIRSTGKNVAALESRMSSLELAIRDLKVNVQQNSVDLRDLTIKVGVLSHLDARVSALER